MGMPPVVHRWRLGAGNCLNLKIIHGLQLQQLIHLAEKPMEKPMEKTTPGKSWNWDFFKFERSSRRSIYESWNVRSPLRSTKQWSPWSFLFWTSLPPQSDAVNIFGKVGMDENGQDLLVKFWKPSISSIQHTFQQRQLATSLKSGRLLQETGDGHPLNVKCLTKKKYIDCQMARSAAHFVGQWSKIPKDPTGSRS